MLIHHWIRHYYYVLPSVTVTIGVSDTPARRATMGNMLVKQKHCVVGSVQ
jgi:hypothetical protein